VRFAVEDARVVVTGGNTGIGRATAVGLARLGARVTITSRNRDRGEEALAGIRAEAGVDDVDLVELDLASFASTRRAAAEILERYDRLDVLVNNAGLALFGGRAVTDDGLEAMFGVNHVGHFLLTTLLLDRIVASAPSRIVVVSSEGYKMAREGLAWDDLQHERSYDAFPVYGHSKLANIHFAVELARRLEGTGVSVNACHPGFVATELGRTRPEDAVRRPPREPRTAAAGSTAKDRPDLSHLPDPLTPEQGAATSVHLASSPAVEGVTGRYFVDSEPVELTPVASDPTAARRLWEITEHIVAQR
jgi:NAD(P)-dependent dehydrogenase (short-subunit alcohol dehydrogenase family)